MTMGNNIWLARKREKNPKERPPKERDEVARRSPLLHIEPEVWSVRSGACVEPTRREDV